MHAFLPRLLDSKVIMNKAIAEGFGLPCTTLGDAFRWLHENYSSATAKSPTVPGMTVDEAVENTGAERVDKPRVEEDNKRRMQAWDALFAPGFEKRYTDNAQEHEAGYDAYLTGCCFVAAATLGLGVGVKGIKDVSAEGVIPKTLAPVVNSVPLYRVVSWAGGVVSNNGVIVAHCNTMLSGLGQVLKCVRV